MGTTSVARHITCSLIILTICTGFGDGRWRSKERRKLERDILMIRKMADEIEREVDDYYDLDEKDKHDFNEYDKGRKNESSQFGDNIRLSGYISGTHIYPTADAVTKNISQVHIDPLSFNLENKTIRRASAPEWPWPRFEDLLDSIGRKYDWKNDRWIKIKHKAKPPSTEHINQILSEDFRKTFDSKHHFKYKYVKLSRSKSKRNVIIAVKAVR